MWSPARYSCTTETWILYNGNEHEVSKSVQKAYQKYGNKEFGTKNAYIHKDNMNRHVKLINITDKEVNFFSKLISKKYSYFDTWWRAFWIKTSSFTSDVGDAKLIYCMLVFNSFKNMSAKKRCKNFRSNTRKLKKNASRAVKKTASRITFCLLSEENL